MSTTILSAPGCTCVRGHISKMCHRYDSFLYSGLPHMFALIRTQLNLGTPLQISRLSLSLSTSFSLVLCLQILPTFASPNSHILQLKTTGLCLGFSFLCQAPTLFSCSELGHSKDLPFLFHVSSGSPFFAA